MDSKDGENAASLFCRRHSSLLVWSGFLTCENFDQKTKRPAWSHSFSVLAVNEGKAAAAKVLYRFLSPSDRDPQEELQVSDLSIKFHGDGILLYSKSRLAHWLLVASNRRDLMNWKAAFTTDAAVDRALNTSNLRKDEEGQSEAKETVPSYTEDVIDGLPLFLNNYTSFDSTPLVAKFSVDTKLTDLKFVLNHTSQQQDETVALMHFRRTASTGGLWNSSIRSICWRILLGIFPLNLRSDSNSWQKNLENSRSLYEELKRKYTNYSGREDFDASASIQLENDSDMEELLKSKILESQIWKDLERTKRSDFNVGNSENFEYESAKQMMLRILYIWARKHPHLGYKQGMNELLAVILFTFHQERTSRNSVQDESFRDNGNTEFNKTVDILIDCTDARFVEHDCFNFLSAIMESMQFLYWTESSQAKANSRYGLQIESRPEDLMGRLEHIQHVLLQRSYPLVAAKLHCLEVQPHMFLIRWIRLLLVRDICLPQVLLVWDAVFACTPKTFYLIDSLCVALLGEETIKSAIVSSCVDSSEGLKVLKGIPNLREDQVGDIVYRGIRIHEDYEKYLARLNDQIRTQLDKEAFERKPSLDFVDSESFESRFQREFFS